MKFVDMHGNTTIVGINRGTFCPAKTAKKAKKIPLEQRQYCKQ